ncbi:hypothetical protein ACLKA7_013090 [Drosophila subpalustris]
MDIINLGLFKFLWLISLIIAVQSALVWNTKAIPIDLPNRHVFLSYNFEASYKLPETWRKKPPIFHRGNETHLGLNDDGVTDLNDYYDEYEEHEPHHHKRKKPKPPKRKKPKPLHHNKPSKPPKKKHKHKNKPKPQTDDYKDFFEGFPRQDNEIDLARRRQEETLLSRTKFYELLSRRFEQHGFGSNDQCLLRLICEANSAQLGNHNGVLGSLIHVMFSPSSSQYEALPHRYYTAESKGKQDYCTGYHAKCGRSLLDLITRPLADYIGVKYDQT